MGLTVYGGGGKPEEEKTVTAGTSTKVVTPSNGKTIKKVTVNPTPSQSKTVTPSTSQQTVSPDSGKLLSKVIVKAMEDVTPEVTAQTPVITQIAENLGITITTPSGTNKQILQGNNANLLNIKDNAKKEGLYVWKKLTAEGGDFIDFVVSDSETAYPDGAVHTDGYWYERVVEGVAGIDFGEVTLSSSSNIVTFEHSLGVIPSFAAFVPKNDFTIAAKQTIMNINGYALYKTNKTLASGTAFYDTSDVGLTETTISFNSPPSSPFKSTTYYWIAIA